MKNNSKSKRVILTEEAYNRLLSIRKEIEAKTFGKRVSLSDITSKFLEGLNDAAIKSQIKKLSSTFFDPVAALAHATKVARTKAESGETPDILEIVKELSGQNDQKRRSRIRKPQKKVENLNLS